MPVAMNPSVSWTNDPLTLTAKVNAVVAPEQVMLWECGFIPSLENALGRERGLLSDALPGVETSIGYLYWEMTLPEASSKVAVSPISLQKSALWYRSEDEFLPSLK